MKLRCLVVDDESIARKGIEGYIEKHPALVLSASASNTFDAEKRIEKGEADLVFLDIKLPGRSGLEMLKTMPHSPIVIITSAYSEYALEAFNLDVIDYLVKPVSWIRFEKAAGKAIEYFALRSEKKLPESQGFFFVKSSGRIEKLFVDDILLVEALQNYVVFRMSNSKLSLISV